MLALLQLKAQENMARAAPDIHQLGKLLKSSLGNVSILTCDYVV
jgi:hypothetical protein